MKKMLFLLVPLLFFGTMAFGQNLTTSSNDVNVQVLAFYTLTIAGGPVNFVVDQYNEPPQTSPTVPTWLYRSNSASPKGIRCNIATTPVITEPIPAGNSGGDASNYLSLSALFGFTNITQMASAPTLTNGTTPMVVVGGATAPTSDIQFVSGLVNGSCDGTITYSLACVGSPKPPSAADDTYNMTVTYSIYATP